jgi:hypothetical protein
MIQEKGVRGSDQWIGVLEHDVIGHHLTIRGKSERKGQMACGPK